MRPSNHTFLAIFSDSGISTLAPTRAKSGIFTEGLSVSGWNRGASYGRLSDVVGDHIPRFSFVRNELYTQAEIYNTYYFNNRCTE